MTKGMELEGRNEAQEAPEKGSQEVGETKAEPLEAPEVSRRVEQVTFDPEAVVQLEGDYMQAEAIQDAFVELIVEPELAPAPGGLMPASIELEVPEVQEVQPALSDASDIQPPTSGLPGLSEVGLETVGDGFVPLGESESSISPDVSDLQESLTDTPLTLEQVIAGTPAGASRTLDVSQEVVQDKSDAIPNAPVETVSQEIDPEVLQEIDLEPLIEEDPFVKASEARAEAQDAAAEAERVGEALDTAEEELEETRDAYEASLEQLQNRIDILNEILHANNHPQVTMTVENGQITLSYMIDSQIYSDEPGVDHPPTGDETADISQALEDRLGELLGAINWESHEDWAAANLARENVLTALESASLAQARMDDAQAKVEDLQAQYSAAVEDAGAAEATAQLYELKIEKGLFTSEEYEEITDRIRMQSIQEKRQKIEDIRAEPLETTEVSKPVEQDL